MSPSASILRFAIVAGIAAAVGASIPYMLRSRTEPLPATLAHASFPLQVGGGETRPDAVGQGRERRMPRDIVGALNEVFSEQSEIQNMRLYMDVLDRHAPRTAETFAAFFRDRRFDRSEMTHWKLFFSSWGTFDFEAAVAFIRARFDQPALQHEFVLSSLKATYVSDPASSLAVVGFILPEDTGPHGSLAVEYLEGILADDPAKGLLGLTRLGDSEVLIELAGRMIRNLAKSDLPAAIARWESTTGEAKVYLFGQLLSAQSETDPAGAAQLLAAHGHPAVPAEALGRIATNYMKVNPVAAFEWIAAIPEGLYTENLLESSAAAWAANDPGGAQSWLATHDPAPEFDAVVGSLAKSFAKVDPALAIETSSQLIHDPARSDEILYHLAMGWKEEQPVEFAHWLEATPLITPGQKQRLVAREFHADLPDPVPAVPAGVPDDGRSYR